MTDSTASDERLSGSEADSIASERSLTECVKNAWNNAVSRLQDEISAPVFNAYIAPLQFSSFNPETFEIVVLAPVNLIRNHVDTTFGKRLAGFLKVETGLSDIILRLDVDKDSQGIFNSTPRAPYVVVKRSSLDQTSETDQSLESEGGFSAKGDSLPSNINPRYTFSNFVVGNSNQFCHAAALQISEKPGMSYNPLFIYGGVGLGKTHLLHAIGNKILDANPSARVLYMSSEAFTNELILALRNSKMDEFKNKMRNIEVLLIDDIQFMVGKERTQEEFFHTFNALYSAKHQIVITSDRIPSDIPQIEERLYTRFSWGLIADIQSPDFETRVAILKRKASIENFLLPPEVANLIAEKVSSNVRELEGALTRLHAMSTIQNIPLTKEFAVSCLRHLFQPKTVNITVDDIKKAVATHFGLKVSDIISKRRTKNLSFPRHIAMYLCRKHTTCSYPEIGEHFGGRDHSSVIHAASVVTTKISNDNKVRDQVVQIERAILDR